MVNQHAKTAKALVSNHQLLGRASGDSLSKISVTEDYSDQDTSDEPCRLDSSFSFSRRSAGLILWFRCNFCCIYMTLTLALMASYLFSSDSRYSAHSVPSILFSYYSQAIRMHRASGLTT